MTKLNNGARKDDILMGVIRALVKNYLFLAKSIRLEPPFVFQGMTAKNDAVVKALEEQLGSKVFVSEHCELMGAVGIALLSKEQPVDGKYEMNMDGIVMKNFLCNDCPNNCEVTQIYKEGKLFGCVGSRCNKWSYKEKNNEMCEM